MVKVSILCPDLSSNCLGRAHVLAELLTRQHDVEIAGPTFGDGIWGPLRDEHEYVRVDSQYRLHQFLAPAKRLRRQVSGDILFASKPMASSFGVGLLEHVATDRPLVLDIDDWEGGLGYERWGARAKKFLRGIPRLINVNSLYSIKLLEKLSRYADARTVSNSFLRDMFGGEIIPHARDTDRFRPENYEKTAMRAELGLDPDDFIVMFSGTPRPHKGVTHLVEAVRDIDNPSIKCVIVGAHDSEYVDRVRALGDDSLLVYGQQPFSDLPKWIAAADVIAIPQRRLPATRGQLPAKVFDAMAMAKPVIATNVSDLPEILTGCGRIVEPDRPSELRDAILELHGNPDLMDAIGKSARNRCVEKYSYDAVAPMLDDVVTSVLP